MASSSLWAQQVSLWPGLGLGAGKDDCCLICSAEIQGSACPGAPVPQLLPVKLLVSFRRVYRSSEGPHSQEGLSTEMFYSAKSAGAGCFVFFFFFLIRFFGCSCGFLHTLSDLCANALTLSALLLGPVMHIFVLCRKCCPWGGTLDPFVLLLCVTKTVS